MFLYPHTAGINVRREIHKYLDKFPDYKKYCWEFNTIDLYQGRKVSFTLVSYVSQDGKYDIFSRLFYKIGDANYERKSETEYAPVDESLIYRFIEEANEMPREQFVLKNGVRYFTGTFLNGATKGSVSTTPTFGERIKDSNGYMFVYHLGHLMAACIYFRNRITNWRDAKYFNHLVDVIRKGDTELNEEVGYNISSAIRELDGKINFKQQQIEDFDEGIRSNARCLAQANEVFAKYGFKGVEV